MTDLVYGSVCSGIEAASVAWAPLGWRAAFVSEIDAAPRAVLTHRYPQVPLHGDFTTISAGEYPAIDLLVGGTPCQSFSVAGLRGGLADDRGNLALQYLRLADRLRPRWLVWENVPGVLSSNGGRDFGAILGGMVELGYGFAYRVLDAQYVRVDGYGRAVPQRRRRVFVVGYLGDWRRPAAVLLERACLRGDPAPRREAGAGVAIGAGGGAGGSCGSAGRSQTRRAAAQAFGGGANCNATDVGTAVSAHAGGRYDLDTETFVAEPIAAVASTLLRSGHSTNPMEETLIAFQQGGSNIGPTGAITGTLPAGNGNESGGVPCIAFDCKAGGNTNFAIGDVSPTMTSESIGGTNRNAVAYGISCDAFDQSGEGATGTAAERSGLGVVEGISPTIKAKRPNGVAHGWSVRRLTPTECERLQGFPDGWTAVPWRGGIMPDGPRYKMLGNSMAVNCMRWIGQRIAAVDALPVPLLPHPKAGGLQDERGVR